MVGAICHIAANQGMPNQTLEQTRDSVLLYGESIGRELLNRFVRCIATP